MYDSFKRKVRGRRESGDDAGSSDSPSPFHIGRPFYGSSPDLMSDPQDESQDRIDSEFARMRLSRVRRDTTQTSASGMSDISPTTVVRTRDRKSEPLGLHVVYTPPGPRTIDLIFVHGLGGTSRLSWSYDRNLANFWPKEWLPLEPGFKDARILTFGYNANFMSQTKDLFNISDFAKDLLLQLKVGMDENVVSLEIGKVPIIFVVHSMGGLVVKKAYILGTQDVQYRDILDNVRGIVFLATPHRGSNLADMLNTLLSATFQSPKQYVTDLHRNSARISDINDQFRLYADKLELVSFFETMPTSVGIKKVFVVERDSAIIGYQHELSAPLNADHHHVNKFDTPRNPNYISVRNVVKTLIDKFKIPVAHRRPRSLGDSDSFRSLPSTEELMEHLGVEPRPTDFMFSIMEQYVHGCCDWIVSNLEFASFMADSALQSSLLHITGGPGTGKTVMASFLIQHLESLGFPTQFWYFRYDHQTRRSNRQCLLSLAFQIMAVVPAYAQKLLSRKTSDLESIVRSDLRSLWQKLFVDVLDTLDTSSEPLYWVIDAIDESESAQAFFQLLASLKSLRFPLRVILLTRTHTITKHFERLRSVLPSRRVSQLTLATPATSLQLFIDDMMSNVPWDDEDLKAQIASDLLHKSQGSFLWLSLVMRDLIYCDTAEQVLETLGEIPQELTDVYERLEKLVARDLRPSDAPLVTAILSWVACAERNLDEEELREALKPKVPLLSVRHTINRLCGDFVIVDKKGGISMVHHTAREYITSGATSQLRVNPEYANMLILDKCLATLSDPRFRMRLKSQGCTGLLRYCCLSWAHHLVHSDIFDGPRRIHYMRTIKAMLSSQAVLTWIEAVAMADQLHVLASTSRALLQYAERLRLATGQENPAARPLADIEYFSSWSTELVRLLGKFGTHLLQCPMAAHTLIPLFCPPDSVIGRQFGADQEQNSGIAASLGPSALTFSSPADQPRITGISNTGWDDALATFTLGPDQRPEAIFGLDSSFAILTSDKCVNLYDATTFRELHRFHHGETIIAAQFNRQGTMLVTAAIRTVKVWNISSGRELYSFDNPYSTVRKRPMRAVAVTFSNDGSDIIIFCIDSVIRRRRLVQPDLDPEFGFQDSYGYYDEGDVDADGGWRQVDMYAADETVAMRRARGSPNIVAFNADGSKIAVAYRISPLAVWDTETGNRISKCEPRGGNRFLPNDKTDYPVKLVWNPASDHVLGIYLNGTVFKWDPMEREAEEMEQRAGVLATELACSADGRLIVTSQRDGSLKVFSFDNFTLLFNLTSMWRPSAMAFSPDSRRIYDLRQSFCNVWQPNALIRIAEQDERGSDAASSHYDSSVTGSQVSEATAVLLQSVTSLAADPDVDSTAYAFGNNGGVLQYIEGTGAQGVVDIKCGLLGIYGLSYSGDGSRLVTTGVGGKVTVCKVVREGLAKSQLGGGSGTNKDGKAVSSMELVFDMVEGTMQQVALDVHGDLMLMHMRHETRVWHVDTRRLVYVEEHNNESCKWLAHPTQEHAFVAVRPSKITCLFVDAEATVDPEAATPSSSTSVSASWNIDYQRLDSIDWSEVAPVLSRKLQQGLGVGLGLGFEARPRGSIAGKGKAIWEADEDGSTVPASDIVVHKVIPTPNCTELLLQMSVPGATTVKRETRFILLDVPFLAGTTKDNVNSADDSPPLLPRALPESVLGLIEIPLGFVVETTTKTRRSNTAYRLAFIDRDFWVRTWSVGYEDAAYVGYASTAADMASGHHRGGSLSSSSCQRHFFLPRDWINMDCLVLATVTLDGRFLCPRSGEVAVVHNGLWGTLGVDA